MSPSVHQTLPENAPDPTEKRNELGPNMHPLTPIFDIGGTPFRSVAPPRLKKQKKAPLGAPGFRRRAMQSRSTSRKSCSRPIPTTSRTLLRMSIDDGVVSVGADVSYKINKRGDHASAALETSHAATDAMMVTIDGPAMLGTHAVAPLVHFMLVHAAVRNHLVSASHRVVRMHPAAGHVALTTLRHGAVPTSAGRRRVRMHTAH